MIEWRCFLEGKQVDEKSSFSSLLLAHKSAITLTITALCQSVYTLKYIHHEVPAESSMVSYWRDSTVRGLLSIFHFAVFTRLGSGTKTPFKNSKKKKLRQDDKHKNRSTSVMGIKKPNLFTVSTLSVFLFYFRYITSVLQALLQ